MCDKDRRGQLPLTPAGTVATLGPGAEDSQATQCPETADLVLDLVCLARAPKTAFLPARDLILPQQLSDPGSKAREGEAHPFLQGCLSGQRSEGPVLCHDDKLGGKENVRKKK